MAKKTVEDLKVLRAELARQMAQEAYDLTTSINQRALERLGTLSEAIYALDDLIAEGVSEPQEVCFFGRVRMSGSGAKQI